jgi:hypothetical protein
MKTKHGLFFGFTVLVLTAIFFLAGCSQPTSSEGSKELVERGVMGVSINPEYGIIGIGRSLQLQAVVWPEDASNTAVSWTSLNPTVASVDQNGLVTGNMDGETEIRVTTKDGGYPASAWILVSGSYVEVSGVSINVGSGTVAVGRTLRLDAVIEPENASNRAVSWSSANDGIATVDQGGMVTGKAVGTVKITATTAEGQKTAETTITVTEAVSNAVSIKFDLSGAKAIAALDTSNSSYAVGIADPRAVTVSASDPLVKILADDTLAPLADFSQYGIWPTVGFIAHSPVAGKKDFYIFFNDEIRYKDGNEEVNLGNFWHVNEDGSIVNILGNEDGVRKNLTTYQNGDPVIFDSDGNMFFIASEYSGSSSTNVIYRYNPQTTASEQLTSTRNNLSYERIVVSPNGALVIAHARNYSGGGTYLRAIPVANPGGYEDIVYSSNSDPVSSFAISPDSRELYFSGSVSRRVGNETQTEYGFFRVSLENLKNMNPVSVFGNGGGKYPITGNSVFYEWQEDYRKADKSPDYDKIMNWFYDSAASTNIEFRYNDKTDKEALVSLTNEQRYALFLNGFISITEVLKQYWVKKGTDTPVTFAEYTHQPVSALVYADSGTYKWKSEFYNGSTVDYGKIMEFIYKAANSRDIEFRYKDKTDTAALTSLSDQDMTDIFNDLLHTSMSNFVTQFCYIKGTDRKVTHIPGSGYNSSYLSELLTIRYNGVWWIAEYRGAEDKPDTDKIMTFLHDTVYSDNFEFRYNGKTDADALASMTEADLGNFVSYWDSNTNSQVNAPKTLLDYCFRKGTSTPASSYIGNEILSNFFSSFKKLMVMSDGSLWGLNNSSGSNRSIFCQILDAGRKRDFYVPNAFINSPGIVKTILVEDPYIYYSGALVSSGGQETAFSKIYRFQVNNADVVDDMFRYIDRNNDRIELDTFSVGADYLYFSGTQGTNMVGGKIDVNSLRYIEMEFGRRLKLVMSY